MVRFNDFNEFNQGISKIMNHNFRVRLGKKYGHKLVGYTGLCLLLGFACANHLILRMHQTLRYDKRVLFKPQIGTTITFYLK